MYFVDYVKDLSMFWGLLLSDLITSYVQGELRVSSSMRNTLYNEWAAVSKCFHYQPLDYVKEYFGVKIGLYFAWLGFYTHMLIPASVVGVICFIYSCLTLYKDQPR
jgi:anoctamin-1